MAVTGKKVKREFPRLAEYLRSTFPVVINNEPVYKAFLKWSELPDSLARHILKREVGPFVGVTSGGSFNGVYRPDTPRAVFLHESAAKLFEDQVPGSILLVQSTLLHELVHWGNYVSQYALDSPKLHSKKNKKWKKTGGYAKVKGKLKEVGKEFEREAYGKDVNKRNMTKMRSPCGTCSVKF